MSQAQHVDQVHYQEGMDMEHQERHGETEIRDWDRSCMRIQESDDEEQQAHHSKAEHVDVRGRRRHSRTRVTFLEAGIATDQDSHSRVEVVHEDHDDQLSASLAQG